MSLPAEPIDAVLLHADRHVGDAAAFASPPIPTGSRSRHWIAAPRVLKPTSIDDAQQAFDAWPDAVPLGGGLDIVNRMKEGWTPGPLVALGGIRALGRIAMDDGTLGIGAAVRHDTLANDSVMRACLPDLADCWDRIANIRIRMQGTVAGNLFAGMPGYEGAILLAAVDACLVGRKRNGDPLRVPVSTWRQGNAEDAPRWITGVEIALPTGGVRRRLFYDRSLRPALSVALSLELVGTTVMSGRAVVGGCHARPIVCELPVADMPLAALRDTAADLAGAALSALPAATVPWHGEPAYRPRMAGVLLTRLLRGSAS